MAGVFEVIMILKMKTVDNRKERRVEMTVIKADENDIELHEHERKENEVHLESLIQEEDSGMCIDSEVRGLTEDPE